MRRPSPRTNGAAPALRSLPCFGAAATTISTTEAELETFLAWLRDGSDFVTTVADLDGTAVGHVTINGNELVHLFVDPDHQGLGLGRMLLAAGEEMLAAAGHIVVELHTMVGNAPAIELYESAGWIVTDGLIHTDETEMSYDEHVLVKHLGGDGRPLRVGPPPRR